MNDIRDDVSARVAELTPAEKRCARVLLADYPAAGLGSAAGLARSAGTSTPTVLRFVARLGFGNYRDFQRRLREEATRAATAPVQRAARERRPAEDSGCAFRSAVTSRAALAGHLLRTVPEAEFDAAVALLAARPRRVLVSGGFFTRHLAHLFAAQLSQLIRGVEFARDPLTQDIGKYLDLTKDGVAVIIDFRRYEESARSLAMLARDQGAKIVLLTDHELSPTAEFSTVVLPVYVEGVPFDSDAGLLILLESLIEGVFTALGESAIDRMSRWERHVQLPRAFRRDEVARPAPHAPPPV